MTFLFQDLKKQLILSLSTEHSLPEANAIANQVFEYILDKKHSLFSDCSLTEEQLTQYKNIKTRLLKGEPLQYILERAYFFDFTLYVNKHVLIPRPETEEMTEWLIKYIQNTPNTIEKVLDIGTGSGCIPITLKKKLPHIHVQAWEISPYALEIAEYNAQKNQAEIHFLQQDLFQSDVQEAFTEYDCIISNPPYIPWKEKHQLAKNVVDHEPHLALFVPDSNPLLFYEAIALRAVKANKPIVTEIHQDYVDAVGKLYTDIGLKNVHIHKDLSQNPRWVTANLTN
jgi:release factor glutamine methyltransferase